MTEVPVNGDIITMRKWRFTYRVRVEGQVSGIDAQEIRYTPNLLVALNVAADIAHDMDWILVSVDEEE